MASAIIDSVGPFLMDFQQELQREVDKELASSDEIVDFDLKRSLSDTFSGLEILEFQTSSNPSPKFADGVLGDYQFVYLQAYEQVQKLIAEPESISARLHNQMFGEPTSKKIAKLRRGIFNIMRLRTLIRSTWPR